METEGYLTSHCYFSILYKCENAFATAVEQGCEGCVAGLEEEDFCVT
jgi:hypothetical protein